MIPYSKPSITNFEHQYVYDAVVNGWGEDCFHYIDKFEKMFSQKVGSLFAAATSSCTGALQLGMHALGISKGDEVILADINWIATVAPIIHCGAKPVFVDISLESWCISKNKIERAITKNTKAIIVTHLYGNIAEIKEIVKIAEANDIYVIEDAAEALGSKIDGRQVGTFGNFGVFSFHGTKMITTGEGGMFVSNDPELFEKVCVLNNHGRSTKEPRHFWPTDIGYKFKMSNIQAALGCAQLQRLDSLVKRKREILNFYKNFFKDYENIQMNIEPNKTINSSWMPTLFIQREKEIRNGLLDCLKNINIDARPTFWPLTSTGLFDQKSNQNKNSYFWQARSINLPSYHDITEENQEMVCEAVKGYVDKTS